MYSDLQMLTDVKHITVCQVCEYMYFKYCVYKYFQLLRNAQAVLVMHRLSCDG